MKQVNVSQHANGTPPAVDYILASLTIVAIFQLISSEIQTFLILFPFILSLNVRLTTVLCG